MEKNFNEWNKKKQKLHQDELNPFYKEREVWWCSLGVNVGFEQDGTGENFDRPVVIVRGFNKNTFLAVALTGVKKKGKYYFYLGKIGGKDSTAILSQIRLIDTKRLIKKVETVNEEIFKNLKKALSAVIFE